MCTCNWYRLSACINVCCESRLLCTICIVCWVLEVMSREIVVCTIVEMTRCQMELLDYRVVANLQTCM